MRKNYIINGGTLCKFDAIIKLLAPVHHLPLISEKFSPVILSLFELELSSEIFQSHPSQGVYVCEYKLVL